MKKAIFINLYQPLIFLLILTVSCKRKFEQCTTCNTASDITVLTKFQKELGGGTVSTRVWYADKQKQYDYADGEDYIESDFKSFEQSLKENAGFQLSGSELLLSCALYLNKPIHLSNEINSDDIVGYSTFTIMAKKLYHRLYIKKPNKTFEELTDLNAQVDGIEINSIHRIMQEVLNVHGYSTSFLLSDVNNLQLLGNLRGSFDQLHKKMKNFLSKKSNLVSRESPVFEVFDEYESESSLCMPPCPVKSGSSCYKGDFRNNICRGSFCLLQASYAVAVERNGVWKNNPDSVDLTVQAPLAYDFRAKLTETETGMKYIDYYYNLSRVFRENLNDLSISLRVLRLMPDVYSLIQDIKKLPSGTVVYNSEKTDKFIAELNYFKSITSDEKAITEIDDIIADVHHYNGRTAGEIREILRIHQEP
jgi:hypothetical protein